MGWTGKSGLTTKLSRGRFHDVFVPGFVVSAGFEVLVPVLEVLVPEDLVFDFFSLSEIIEEMTQPI
jgi:hypothetical protein